MCVCLQVSATSMLYVSFCKILLVVLIDVCVSTAMCDLNVICDLLYDSMSCIDWCVYVSTGCYCDVCMKGFKNALMSDLNATTRKQLNVTDTWSYRAYLLGASHVPAPNRGVVNQTLRKYFVDYQSNVTSQYILNLRAHLRATVTRLSKGATTDVTLR